VAARWPAKAESLPPGYLSIEPNQPDSSSRLQKHAVRSFRISCAASIVVSSMRTLVFFEGSVRLRSSTHDIHPVRVPVAAFRGRSA
jgi:hypothetical protein